MKNIFFAVSVLTAMTSLALADQSSMAAAAKVTAPAAALAVPVMGVDKVLAGLVKAVSLPDAIKGTKSEIIVTDITGKDVAVLVKATTTLYDVDAKATTLDKIVASSKVGVIYKTTAEGVNEAKSVKIVK